MPPLLLLLDVSLSIAVVGVAVAFLVSRFQKRQTKKAQDVIVGASLQRALKKAQAKKR